MAFEFSSRNPVVLRRLWKLMSI
ncbi:hypothetical protein Gohar_019409 [Gossypium harknessii]|uniref:Uncharacterized protein n=1 Tax=Gossypium harknessii TaxID=34285 RepID=A0A7J9IBD2_9ROSI|nr:hypothetical protein [Gossypium harknessii]